jgi:competence protein ComGG
MIKSQKGFTYPLTLTILIAFLIFFSNQVEQLLTEKKLFRETKIILQEEYYMFISVEKMESKFQSGEPIAANGSFQFLSGNVNFKADLPTGNLQKITFTLKLPSGETATGFGYFDQNAKKLLKWVEKN